MGGEAWSGEEVSVKTLQLLTWSERGPHAPLSPNLTEKRNFASVGPMPHRRRYLFVCTNRREEGHPKSSCAQKGAEAVVVGLKEALAKRGVAREIRACSTSCLDLCEEGVSIVQEPDHVVYARVTMEDIPDIVEAVALGGVVERLVAHR